MKLLSKLTFFSVFLSSIFLLSSCKEQSIVPRQILEVSYVVVKTEEIAIVNELPGRLESYRNSDVRARVAGVLEKRLFEEGSDVQKGDKLFIIDPRSYEASVENARAALARAEANFMQADLKYRRYEPLVGISAISKQEFDDAKAAQKQAAADVAAAKAALTNAKLDLEYSAVLAPISGRIGRSMVTEGALVGQADTTLLAVIQQIDPIYLNLTQSSAELLQLQQAMKKGILKGASEEGLKVTLIMEDGSIYPHTGQLLFSDITVDPTTGEVSIRALFPNQEKVLLPGVYVRGRIEQAINENAITIPKQAVLRSPQGSFVYIINKDNVIESRRIQTGASYKERWVVLDGLQVGEKIVVEGLQKAKPDMAVVPHLWDKENTLGQVDYSSGLMNASQEKKEAIQNEKEEKEVQIESNEKESSQNERQPKETSLEVPKNTGLEKENIAPSNTPKDVTLSSKKLQPEIQNEETKTKKTAITDKTVKIKPFEKKKIVDRVVTPSSLKADLIEEAAEDKVDSPLSKKKE